MSYILATGNRTICHETGISGIIKRGRASISPTLLMENGCFILCL